jgi:cysteine desulfurase family protein (TIGR01976 family)
MQIDLSFCRSEFPALQQSVDGHPVAFLDGPGGTQVPQSVIDAIANYLMFENSNTHGNFLTSQRTDRRLAEAREAMADFLGASPDEIAFGNNMTSLSFALSRALGRDLGPGDRVVITDLDHEANRGPWLALAETGAEVVSVRVDLETCTLDLDDFRHKITPDTRIVALGYASNAVGTVNDVETVCRWAKEAGAISVVDAVHYAPHGPIDVKEVGCDFLLCSSYKFFGPHVGIIYGRSEAFDALKAYRVAPQEDSRPYKIETGTLNHEGIAGLLPAVEFVASIGGHYPSLYPAGMSGSERRKRVVAGMRAIASYEHGLAENLFGLLRSLNGVRIYGPGPSAKRAPTFSFTVKDAGAAEVAAFLGKRGIFVWDGDFYASRLVTLLGLVPRGGLVRVGLAPYNTGEEIGRLAQALEDFLATSSRLLLP